MSVFSAKNCSILRMNLHTQINAKLWGILSALGRGNTLEPEKVQNLLRDLLNKGRLLSRVKNTLSGKTPMTQKGSITCLGVIQNA